MFILGCPINAKQIWYDTDATIAVQMGAQNGAQQLVCKWHYDATHKRLACKWRRVVAN